METKLYFPSQNCQLAFLNSKIGACEVIKETHPGNYSTGSGGDVYLPLYFPGNECKSTWMIGKHKISLIKYELYDQLLIGCL